MANEKEMPVEPADIENAVRRLWQLEDFLEELTGILFDNTFFPDELKNEIEQAYMKKF